MRVAPLRLSLPLALSLLLAAPALVPADAGAASNEPADVMIEQMTCPIDGEVFTAIVGVNAHYLGQRLDTRRLGASVEPIPLPVCPTTGFVVYRRDFTPEQLALAQELVDTTDFRRQVRTGNEYTVAAYVAEQLGESRMVIAHFWLEASWLFESDPVRNPEYLARAYDWYTLALEEVGNDQEKFWQVQALRVELLRRLGRFDEARTLLTELPLNSLPTGHALKRVLIQQQLLLQRGDSQPRPVDG
jgi:hypothetical protein